MLHAQFAPLTGLEVLGFRVDGSVLVVEAKFSVNLNVQGPCQLTLLLLGSLAYCTSSGIHAPDEYPAQALTIEQVVSKRRKVVQDMCAPATASS